jgi:hypothetical protein
LPVSSWDRADTSIPIRPATSASVSPSLNFHGTEFTYRFQG